MSKWKRNEPEEKAAETKRNYHFEANHELAKKLVKAHLPKLNKEFCSFEGCRRLVHAFSDRFEMSWTENNARHVMIVEYNQSTYEFMDQVRRSWSLFEKKK